MKWLSLRLATLVLSVSVAILLAEGFVRLLVPAWLWRYRDATADWLVVTAKEISVAFCPLVDHFVSQQNRGPFHLLPRDPHCNPAGYRVQAEALARFLRQSGTFADRRSAAVRLRDDAVSSALR